MGTPPIVAGNATAGPDRTQAELFDVRGVAQLVGVSPRHILRLAATGRMPAPIKLGALTRWNRRAVMAWIEAGCPAAERGGQSE